MTRSLAHILLLILSSILLLGQRASAAPAPAPLLDAEQRFSLQLPSGFEATSPPQRSQALHYFLAKPGIVASVTRFASANRAAYQKKHRAEFIDQIEAGLARNVPGYAPRKTKKFSRIDRTPILDLEFLRGASSPAPERIYMRFIFHYRFTVVATASIPAGASKTSRRQAQRFSHALLPLKRPRS